MIQQLLHRSARPLMLIAVAGTVFGTILVPGGFAQQAPTTAPAVAAPTTAPAVAAGPASQPAPAAAALPSPSMLALQQLLVDHNYGDLVKESNRLLGLKANPTEPLSRFQVVMLKGEGQAGLKLTAAAVDTFKAAAHESKDPREIALSFWTAELFRHSSGLAYVPKAVGPGGKRPDPIPLLDLSMRMAAFQALLDDQLAALAPKIKTASTSQNLPTIMPVVEQLIQLNDLDNIANGNDDATARVAGALMTHSKGILIGAVKSMWTRAGDIEAIANRMTQVQTQQSVNGQLQTVYGQRRTGLTHDQQTELRTMIDTCGKVHGAANAFLEMARTDDGWSVLISDSDRVAAKCNDLLNADYTTVTADPNSAGTGVGGSSYWQNGTLYQNGQPVYNQNGQPVIQGGNDNYLPGTSYPTNNQPYPPTRSGGTTPSQGTGTGANTGTGTGTGTGTPTTPAAPPTTPSTPATPATPPAKAPTSPQQAPGHNGTPRTPPHASGQG